MVRVCGGGGGGGGGSDLSATVLGAALELDEVQVRKDVDGGWRATEEGDSDREIGVRLLRGGWKKIFYFPLSRAHLGPRLLPRRRPHLGPPHRDQYTAGDETYL